MKDSNNQKTSEASIFVKKLVGFSTSSYLCAIITFLASFINTRVYSTTTMGQINMFFTIQTFVLYFAYFGLDQAYCRYYYEYKERSKKRHLLNICISISLYVSLIISCGLIIAGNPLSRYISGSESRIVICSLVVSVFAQVIWRYLSLIERMKQHIVLYTILMVLNSVTNKLSFTGLAWFSKDFNICVLAIAVSSLIVTVVFYFLQDEKMRFISPRIIRSDEMSIRAMKFGIPLMPVSLIAWFNSSIPILLLQRISSYEAVGIYSSTVVLASIIGLIQSGFNTFWVPYYYENYLNGQQKIRKIHNVICYIMVAFAICLIAFKPLIYYILGSDYRSGSMVFALLLVSPVCYTISETTGIGIGISEKSYLNSIIFTVGAFANFLIAFILIPQIGIMGAGLAVAISSILTLILKTIIGEKYYSVVSSNYKYTAMIVTLVLATIADYYAASYGEIVRFLLLFMIISLYSILYREEIKYLLKTITDMIKVKLI